MSAIETIKQKVAEIDALRMERAQILMRHRAELSRADRQLGDAHAELSSLVNRARGQEIVDTKK